MRQVMPHRNNMGAHSCEGKNFLRRAAAFRGGAAILQHALTRLKLGRCNNIIRYNGLRRATLPQRA
jgi:hypothetical protein